jgi:hypothetical protein
MLGGGYVVERYADELEKELCCELLGKGGFYARDGTVGHFHVDDALLAQAVAALLARDRLDGLNDPEGAAKIHEVLGCQMGVLQDVMKNTHLLDLNAETRCP